MAADDIAPEQCRAARAYLGWSQKHLARLAGVAELTVYRLEKRSHATLPENRALIRQAIERAGVTFNGNDLLLPWTRPAGR